MVDLEDVEAGVGVAVGEGVEACTEEDVLGDSVGDGLGERVFGVAAAGDHEGAEGDGVGTLFEVGVAAGCAVELFGVGAEDGDGDGVSEDEGMGVEELVRGSAQGHAESSTGWACVFHVKECR
jgi:hypothetical protein